MFIEAVVRRLLVGAMLSVLAASAARADSEAFVPLTKDEIAAAVALLREAGRATEASRFPLLTLHEPAKRTAGGPTPREVFAVVYEPGQRRTFETVVDLDRRQVLRWQEIRGVEPQILMEEYGIVDEILRADAHWRAALERRGIHDPADVQIDPWPAGHYHERELAGRRAVKAVPYLRAGAANAYARPIEGLVAWVDLNARRALKVIDTGIVPLAPRADLAEGSVARRRPALRPLETTQPEGPSFERSGHRVRWQNWEFQFAVDAREGLVLYATSYLEGERRRAILHRASVSEFFVPYAASGITWSFRNAFDQGEIDLGRYANSLEPGTDAPAYADFVDAVFANDRGEAYTVPRAVALWERDGGLLWKHYEYGLTNESRRGRELVLGWIANQGTYEYGFHWVFHQDGTLEMEVLLAGIVLPRGVSTPRAPAGDGRTGRMVGPGIAAVHHQHWMSFRLDLDVDGPTNSVVEVWAEPAPAKGGHGGEFVAQERVLRRELEARRRLDLSSSRSWVVVNPGVKNSFGQPVGYRLQPGENAQPLATPGSILRQRAGFMDAHVWVTRNDPTEKYAAGAYVNQNPRRDGLPRWVQQNRSIVNTDVVLWYTMGITHLPRPEDWPVMPVHRAGFKLVPYGFFDANPGLDVPRPVTGGASAR